MKNIPLFNTPLVRSVIIKESFIVYLMALGVTAIDLQILFTSDFNIYSVFFSTILICFGAFVNFKMLYEMYMEGRE